MATLRWGGTSPDFTQNLAELAQRFPEGFKAVKPYLRFTPQPAK